VPDARKGVTELIVEGIKSSTRLGVYGVQQLFILTMMPMLHTSRIAIMILGFRCSFHWCVSFAVISRSSAPRLVALFPAGADKVTPQISLGTLPSSPLSFLFRSSNRKKSHGLISGLYGGWGACRN
jgi:hypothetical protein